MKSFASDNFSGAHPAVVQALLDANHNHAVAYGADPWTDKARQKFCEVFGVDVEVFFAFNGTGANNMALKSALQPWGRVVCGDMAHLVCDESTAPTQFLNCMITALPTSMGKLIPDHVCRMVTAAGGIHRAQPQVLSITQSTELGTVYSVEEIGILCNIAHSNGLYVHVDGARVANAVASVGTSAYEMFVETGVDVVSFGGTKNGAMFGEAVVVLNPKLAINFGYLHKISMQLASKMRFVAAQFNALLQDDLWLKIASHSNAMAQIFAAAAVNNPDVRILFPVQANAIFAEIPADLCESLKKKAFFWEWNYLEAAPGKKIARFMTTFDTTEAEILEFWG